MSKQPTSASGGGAWPLGRRGDAAAAALRGALAALRHLVATWIAQAVERRAIAALEGLDDRTLRDIGLTRFDIAYASRHGRHAGWAPRPDAS